MMTLKKQLCALLDPISADNFLRDNLRDQR